LKILRVRKKVITKKPFIRVLFLGVFLLLMTSCYGSCVAVDIASNQRGIDLDDGVNPTIVKAPGRVSNSSQWAKLELVDIGVKTFTWNDPSMVTRDKQPIGLTLSISVERPIEQERLFDMYNKYRPATLDDAALQDLVFSRVPRVAKGVTSGLSLDELLSRGDAQTALFDALQKELNEFNINLKDVGISDIQTSDDYTAALGRKAASQIEAEIAKQDALKLEQDLLKEKKQTEIDLEIARRENDVAVEKAKVYNSNPFALELERLRVMADAIKPSDKIFFVPQGSNITMFFTANGEATTNPVIMPPAVAPTLPITP
jgi:regulator of protease activity HflC (stomatin/prohibitin superfamily)